MNTRLRAALRPQKVRFVVVGGANTLIDFALLNVLTGIFGLPRIPSNIVSMTAAMIFSFVANRSLVFKSRSSRHRRQAALFVAGTLFGLYVLQTGAIYFLTEVWTWPLDVAIDVVHALGLDSILSDSFVYTNAAKAFATLLSLVWNYNFYKRVVFKDEPKQ